jgi:hypothetical protein
MQERNAGASDAIQAVSATGTDDDYLDAPPKNNKPADSSKGKRDW